MHNTGTNRSEAAVWANCCGAYRVWRDRQTGSSSRRAMWLSEARLRCQAHRNVDSTVAMAWSVNSLRAIP